MKADCEVKVGSWIGEPFAFFGKRVWGIWGMDGLGLHLELKNRLPKGKEFYTFEYLGFATREPK